MPKLLTIIVPTYNMEKYLDKCLTSLIIGDAESEQMCSLEVLVINDGSKDQSSEIAHGYERRFPHTFRLVDKMNGNYGSCINAALPIATGKYVKVLDADDWFDTAQFKHFLSYLSNVDVDAVISDFDKVDVNGKILESIRYSNLPNKVSFPLSAMKEYFSNMWMHAVTYRTQVLRDIQYHQSEGISYTDQEWIFLPMASAKVLSYFPGSLYKYLIGRDGQTVNVSVWEDNFWMEIQGTETMLEQLSFFKNTSKINFSYLYDRIKFRLRVIYYAYMFRFQSSRNDSLLRDFDSHIHANYIELYNYLDGLDYKTTKGLRIKYIKLWHWGISRSVVHFFISVISFVEYRLLK